MDEVDANDAIGRARARIERDAAASIAREKRALLNELLEVVDDLDRALASASGDDPALVEGVRMVREGFLDKLASHGVERFQSQGEPFDPSLHDAVAASAVRDPREAGRVLRVFRPGYRIGGEVLRPASVEVGRLVA